MLEKDSSFLNITLKNVFYFRNDFWEGIKAHNAVVTCAVFAPNPDHMIRMITEREQEAKMANKDGDKAGEVVSVATFELINTWESL